MAEMLTVPFGKPQTVAGGMVRREYLQLELPLNNKELAADQELAARTTPPYQPEGTLEKIGLYFLYPDTAEAPQIFQVPTKDELQRLGKIAAAGTAVTVAVAMAASHNHDSPHHPYTGPGLGQVLLHNIPQAYTGAEESLVKESQQVEQNALSAVTTTQEIASAITGLGGQHSTGTKPHASIQYHAKPHKPPKAAIAKNHPDQCSSTGHMSGKTPKQIVMNYFVICDKYSVAQAAGIEGNLEQESSLNPEEIENGGNSKNPADAGHGGWGLEQLTPGSRAISEFLKYHIKGPINELQPQLVLVSAELKNVSPTGQRNVAQKLRQATSTNTAAKIFERDVEEGPIADIGGGQLANRQEYAKAAAHDFGAAALSLAHNQWGSNKPHRSNSQHTAVNPGIYRAALKYNTASYAEIMAAGHMGVDQWHIRFPEIGPQAVVDCSGLVNLAEADAARRYGVKPNDNTTTERTSKLWYRIPFSKAGQGDIMQPNKNHVVIIDWIKRDTIYSFAARTSKVPQPEQVGPSVYKKNSKEVFLRYDGPGAPLK